MATELGAEPTLRSYLLILRRRRWWIVAPTLLGLGISLAWSFTATKQYTATAQVLLQSSTGPSAPGAAPQPVTPTDVQTAVQLVTSAPVANAVRHELGSWPPVSAAQVASTNEIAISATSGSPARAARVANAYANAFISHQRDLAFRNLTAGEAELRTQISSISHQLKSLRHHPSSASQVAALLNQQAVLKEQLAQIQVNGVAATGGIELVTPAQAPASPSSPRPVQDTMFGLLAGLIAGLAAAFLRNNVDEALSSKEAVEHWGGAPVLGLVPAVTAWRRRDQALVVSLSQPTSPAAEAYRSLRTSLQFARHEQALKVLLVSSPAATEGKTSTVANLGVVFAQAGERVALVSCDLRRPRLGQFFGMDEQAGLTTVLLGQQPLHNVLQPVDDDHNLWVLPAGHLPTNPAELLNGAAARGVFAELSQRFDLVIIDSPPMLPVTDATVLSKEADATLLVVAAGHTRRGDLHRAAEKLAQANATVVGSVLNEVTKQSAYAYGYGYGYGYKPYAAVPPLTTAAAHPNGDSPATASSPGRTTAV